MLTLLDFFQFAAFSHQHFATLLPLSLSMGAGMEDLDVPAGAVSRNDLDNAIEAGDWAGKT